MSTNKCPSKITKGKKFTDEKPVMVLHDIFFYYVQHTEGGVAKLKFRKKKETTLLEREYTLQILISKAMCKQIKKFHKKLSPREVSAAEFKEQFKVDVPYINDSDEYHTINISNNAGYTDKKSGEVKALSAPTVVNSFKESLADTLIGNGSRGMMGINVTKYDHPEFGAGTSINIGMIKITDLVEYVSEDNSSDDDDDFEFEEHDDLESSGGDDGFDEEPEDDTPTESTKNLADAEAEEALAKQKETKVEEETDTDEIF